MEGRHCLAAASIIANQAGELPSEAAAQESKYLPLGMKGLKGHDADCF